MRNHLVRNVTKNHAVVVGITTCLALTLAACSSDGGSDGGGGRGASGTATESATSQTATTADTTGEPTGSTTSETTAAATTGASSATESESADRDVTGDVVGDVVAGEAFPADRCEANKAAGTITYLSGFDYAAAASIVEVIVADAKGYYDDMCLDVEFVSSFSTANPPLIAANEAQFSSGGSFSEVAAAAAGQNADLVVVSTDGHVPIDSLMVKPDQATSLADLKGKVIGVQTLMTPSIVAMLADQGLVEGTDFTTVALPGYVATDNFALPDVTAIGGWRSNEPGQLDRAGVTYDLYAAGDAGVPGSFGIIYTNAEFLAAHPTAAEDFMRATIKGLNDAIDDPAMAAQTAVDAINANGNPNYLSPEGETFRWQTEAGLITETTPDGMFPGMIDGAQLVAEVAAYDAVGVYGTTGAPSTDGRFDPDLVAGLYDADGAVVWPG